jgi:hypothetical protein
MTSNAWASIYCDEPDCKALVVTGDTPTRVETIRGVRDYAKTLGWVVRTQRVTVDGTRRTNVDYCPNHREDRKRR